MITYDTYDDGEVMDCPCYKPGHHAIKEYYGLCQTCWVDLTPEERAALQNKEVVERVVRIYEPAPSLGLRVFDAMWRFGITGTVTYLVLQ